MSETIKGYKAFGPGMVCRDKQYAENTIYEEPEAKLCERGMHYCTEPTDVLAYYPLVDENGDLCEFAEVEDLEPVEQKRGDDSKRVTKKLKINGKISFAELVNASINIVKITEESDIKCTDKNYARIGSSGDSAQIGSSGYYAQIGSSGDSARIGSSGYSAQIGSSGENAVVAAIGRYSIAKAKKGSWIVLAEYDNSGKPLAVVSKQVDGEEIKEDTFYRLEDGRFMEVQL